MKRDRNGVHEIHKLRGECGEYHSIFPHLKAKWKLFFPNILELILKSTPTFWGKLNNA